MKINFPVLILILSMSLSCTRGISKNEIFQNEKIESSVKKTLEDMDSQVFRYLHDNNYDLLSQLFSDTMQSRVQPSFSQKFMPQIQKVIYGKTFKIFDEFYISRDNIKDTINLASGNGENAYKIKFNLPNKETYLAMLVSGDSLNEVMITVIYVKEGEKWKIMNLMGEDFSLNNKDAIKQFRFARSLEQDGDLADATNYLQLAKTCLKPGSTIFTYGLSDTINQYADSLMARVKAKYVFPITMTQVASKAMLFNIHLENIEHHLSPLIMYQTTIKVSDTVALKAENLVIQKNIGSIIRGIDKNNRSILYRAYNDLPDGRNDPRYFGFLQRLN